MATNEEKIIRYLKQKINGYEMLAQVFSNAMANAQTLESFNEVSKSYHINILLRDEFRMALDYINRRILR